MREKKNSKSKSKSSSERNQKSVTTSDEATQRMPLSRRGKRVKQADLPLEEFEEVKTVSRVRSRLSKKHEEDSKSGGIEAILPSLGIVLVLGLGLVAKNGWRGRSTVAGVDLGTTNSVICVQKQSKGAEGKCSYCNAMQTAEWILTRNKIFALIQSVKLNAYLIHSTILLSYHRWFHSWTHTINTYELIKKTCQN